MYMTRMSKSVLPAHLRLYYYDSILFEGKGKMDINSEYKTGDIRKL